MNRDRASDGPGPSGRKSGRGEEAIEPTLKAYYGNPKVSAAAWIEALKAAQIAGFSDRDSELVSGELTSTDPDLEKTRKLSDVSGVPSAVERWIDHLWRHAIRTEFVDSSFDFGASATDQLTRLASTLGPAIRQKDKARRRLAENLLRISLRQILQKREIDPADCLRIIARALRGGSDVDERSLRRTVRQMMERAKIPQLRDLTLPLLLADAQAGAVKADLANVRAENLSLKVQLDSAQDQHKRTEEQLTAAENRIGELEAEVEKTRRSAHENRQVGAHGQSEIKSRLRAFLAGKLDPLLADAVDAVEIAMADVTKERLASARAAIRGEVGWLDEPSD